MLTLGSFLLTVSSIAFVVICVFMVLVILIQKPKGGGLSGAFGGAGGGSQAVFGAKVGDFLTWFTVTLFALFLLVAIALVFIGRSEGKPPVAAPTDAVQPADTDMGDPAPGTTDDSETTDETTAPAPAETGDTPAPAPDAPAEPAG